MAATILAFCEAEPDWIQYSNMAVQATKRKSTVTAGFLSTVALGNLRDGDHLVIIGHGDTKSIGQYAAKPLALLLFGKLEDHAVKVVVQTCSSAEGLGSPTDPAPILQELKDLLGQYGLTKLTFKGTAGASVTGCASGRMRVVDPNHVDAAGDVQDALMNNPRHGLPIKEAEEKIATRGITDRSSSTDILRLAADVRRKTKGFLDDFQSWAKPYLIADRKQGTRKLTP